MACSTCIRAEAIRRVSTISCWLSRALPLKNGGMFSLIPMAARSSCISKPLSATTASPTYSNCNIPLRLVSSSSEIHPAYKSEIKVIAPMGAIPNNTLYVLLVL